MTDLLRVVLDTNVFVAALLSRSPSSPTHEVLQRFRDGEFNLIVCKEHMLEIVEKLIERGVPAPVIGDLLEAVENMAVKVSLEVGALVPAILPDSDDDIVLACAVIGKADYLVTYDPHFDVLGGSYEGIQIVKVLPFLWLLRGDEPRT